MKHSNRNIFFIIIILFACFPIYAQQPDFMFTQSFPLERLHYGSYSLEVLSEDGVDIECYFVAVCYGGMVGVEGLPVLGGLGEVSSPAGVVKLSPTGEFLGELTLGQEMVSSLIDGLYCDPYHKDFYLILGRIENEEHSYQKIFLAQFDKQLNLHWIREIELQDDYKKYMIGVKSFMDSQSNFVICTMPVEEIDPYIPSTISQRILIRISTDGNLLAISEFPEQTLNYEGSQGQLFEYQDGSGDYGQISQTRINNLEATLWRMNRNFEVVNQKSLPNRIETLHDVLLIYDYDKTGAKLLSDGSLLIGGFANFIDKENFPIFHSDVSFMMKFDENDSLVQLSYVRPESDVIKYPAHKNNMDGKGNAFFICDWHVPGPGYLDVSNTMVVTKTDNNANILWQRYYQEDSLFFVPMSITATGDEGCLVSGSYWDVPDNLTEYIFVLKFFADGSLSVPEMERYVRPYCFYPNPVQAQLQMQFSPDVQPRQVELYDLQGRLVRTQRSNFGSIDMSQLPAGAYMLRVTLEDGKVFSDKVVKD
ncbi:MAG: T9SS type A sorting domain-containing protein [Bacteroidales bacterium]|nr:T9SS type A sorting domain-containing protein [Bacteroidales bacterium]